MALCSAASAAEENRAPTTLGPAAATTAPAPAPVASRASPELCSDKQVTAGFVPAVASKRTPPEFPEAEASEESEGWVRVGFTIDADGATKDVVALDSVGSPAMTKAARQAVARWRYKAATQ